MATEPVTPAKPELPNFAPQLYSIALLVVAIIVTGIWLIGRYTAMDLARDMQVWQEKLNLIAESRTAEVNAWTSEHFRELRSLADNPSLQLYLSELQSAAESAPTQQEPAQKAYLRNLLLFTADRTGFAAPGGVEAIKANVPQESKNGMAVIDNKNQVVVSTAMQPSTREIMLERAAKHTAGQEALIDIQKDAEGSLYIGFIVPIYSIQGEHNPESQIGKVVGVKAVDNNLFALLKHPGTTEKTIETILLRNSEDGKMVEFISPLQDSTAALGKQIERDVNKSAESMLLKSVGDFITEKKDYRDKQIFATSRHIPGTPWTLVVKIDRHEALIDSNAQRESMVVFFFLIIAIIVLIVIAVWWHAHSRRSMLMSQHFKKLLIQSQAQEQLLRLVADHQPEPIYIVDKTQTYRFANQKEADAADMSAPFVIGKTLHDVRGGARADHIWEQCSKALKQNQLIFDVAEVPGAKKTSIVRSAYVPLDHIPVVTLPPHTPGVLVVEQDISDAVREREKRLATLNQVIQTLVRLVDRRDPFAANHSLLVSQLANEIASDMELDSITLETTRVAGCLMNVGKILVPAELLTKTESLNDDEKRIIRDSMQSAADLVKDISFDGPVAETLRQWQEHWDGSGPLGIRGEAILISARIISVTNAFIGMISPRSWRTAIPIESANKFLLDQADGHFDRKVVIALVNFVENHSGAAWLKRVLEEQRNVA